MKFKTLITINSVLALITGLFCVIIPAKLLEMYNVSLSPIGVIIYQFWGAALIGLGMLTWIVRSIVESTLQWRLTFALFITNGLSCFMAFRGQYAGANTFGWSTVALFFLLTLGFAVFMFVKPRN